LPVGRAENGYEDAVGFAGRGQAGVLLEGPDGSAKLRAHPSVRRTRVIAEPVEQSLDFRDLRRIARGGTSTGLTWSRVSVLPLGSLKAPLLLDMKAKQVVPKSEEVALGFDRGGKDGQQRSNGRASKTKHTHRLYPLCGSVIKSSDVRLLDSRCRKSIG
jgi:hypothetical protein